MKKMSLIVAGVLMSAHVLAAPGVFVQGDVGVSKVKIKDEGSLSKNGFTPRLTVGYDFGNNVRAGVDYTHYKNFEYNLLPKGNGKAKFQSVGISAIYDFDMYQSVKPYVGARLGINRVSNDWVEEGNNYKKAGSYRKTRTGAGVLAGVSYDVAQNVALDAGYRYNYWGKFDDVKVDSHEASVGVRVKF
ncbi:autotransporter outer membrane beta-barrel domain-containing protein [Neisseria weixii]|uniref:Autotransporter outer membrane beta-barrel domain-containing protein n=2 Tax=Neisseria weixii TaxID=1853276 RepID=A0A3N4N0I5_9NEIS|nr:opacity family porin [Neisseria weixii]ATD65238.1 autotransporter outer membrane beta-barrel domain-containing protein [Neisseria weixii]RPD89764.1 autotransporter outer membrane beta-barrel domain-containing protein [Neisseria weixii]RPD90062.1 autotransporter outer membrane beta-barrel domain-containing protein [Neisseria weixii]